MATRGTRKSHAVDVSSHSLRIDFYTDTSLLRHPCVSARIPVQSGICTLSSARPWLVTATTTESVALTARACARQHAHDVANPTFRTPPGGSNGFLGKKAPVFFETAPTSAILQT